jgi:hypothetical protein
MQNEFYNQPVVNWAKQNLTNPVVIKPFFSSRWGKIFINLLLFSIPGAFVIVGIVSIILFGFNMDAYRPLACGGVLCLPCGLIVALGWYMQGKFVKSLDADGVTGSSGRKYDWGKLYYVDHVSKYVRHGGRIKDNQLDLVFENAKLIVPPLIHDREQIWNLINSMPVEVRDDGVVRENQTAQFTKNKEAEDMSEMTGEKLLKMIESLPPKSKTPEEIEKTKNETEINAAIRQWMNKQIEATALLRKLVSYDDWTIPVSEEAFLSSLANNQVPAWLFSEDNGVKRLFVFTGADAQKSYLGEKGAYFISYNGADLFGSMDEHFDFICINPDSEMAISYGREHFAMLREMSAAVKIERRLVDLRAGKENDNSIWADIRNYQNYILPVKYDEAGNSAGVPFAPDEKNRNLLPVFTAEDYFFAFQTDYFNSGESKELKIVRPYKLNGTELFEQILKMNLDGIVFNCAGGGKPIAFMPQIAQVILSSSL